MALQKPKLHWLCTGAIALLAGLSASAARAVTITVNFAPNFPSEDPNTYPQHLKYLANARKVVRQAAANWVTALGGAGQNRDLNVTVTVEWRLPDPLPPGVAHPCGLGGVTTQDAAGNRPLTGTILLAPHEGANALDWFIDPTPDEHTEYDGVAKEPWHGTPKDPARGGPPANKVDLLTCAKHEFGHVLGFHYSAAIDNNMNRIFKRYVDEIDANAGIKLRAADFGNRMLSIPVGQGDNNKKSHFAGNAPNLPDPNDNVNNANVIPVSHLLMQSDDNVNASDFARDRILMSPYDVGAVAVILNLPAGSYNLRPKTAIPVGARCPPNGPIPPCMNDDGCCPPGCSETTDNDCAIVVPAASQRSLALIVLMLLTGITVRFGWRRTASVVRSNG